MINENSKYYNSLQFLKVIACLGIVFGHCFCSSDNIYLYNISTGLGGFGNSIFFVISGFLLFCHNYDETRGGIKNAFRKIQKLYILHIITMLLWVCADIINFYVKRESNSFLFVGRLNISINSIIFYFSVCIISCMLSVIYNRFYSKLRR